MDDLQIDLYHSRMSTYSKSPSPLAVLCKQRRRDLKLSQAAVAERVRQLLTDGGTFSQQTYAAFESGETRNSRYAMEISQVLGITIQDRAQAIAELAREAPSQEPPADRASVLGPIDVWDDETPLDDDEVEVPLYKDVELSAGVGRAVSHQPSKAKLRFGKMTLRRQGIEPANVICVAVSGASMEPVLPHGSTVGVDQGKTAIKDGDIYAISHNDHLRVKLLYKLPGGMGIRVRSYNKDEFPDEEYSQERIENENIVVLGRVFWYSVLR